MSIRNFNLKQLFQEIYNTTKWSEFKDWYVLFYRSFLGLIASANFHSWVNQIMMGLLFASFFLKCYSKCYDPKVTHHRIFLDLIQLQTTLLYTTPFIFSQNNIINQNIWNIDQELYTAVYKIVIMHEIYNLLTQAKGGQRWTEALAQQGEEPEGGGWAFQNQWGWANFTLACLCQLWVDIKLQLSDEANKRKDVQVMKVIHDLKNPILSIKNSLIDIKISPENVLKTVQHDCEDMEEMLENMRAEFKLKQGMAMREELKNVESVEFAKSFGSTHQALTENGKNFLRIIVKSGFPQVLRVPRTLIKRMVNNFVTNSLKHTEKGYVNIEFKPVLPSDLEPNKEWIHVGVEPDPGTNQLIFEIRDTGRGIPPDKIHKIFDEKESDDTGANFDGTGLGLPICAQLCHSVGAFIRYRSIQGENSGSTFRLFIQDHCLPEFQISEVKLEFDQLNENNVIDVTQTHICNMLLIAEDQKSIMKRYTRWLDNNSMPYKSFYNGRDMLEFVHQCGYLNCSKCSKLLVFTDLNMPQLTGLEFATQIRMIKTEKDFRLVLISADELENNELFDQTLEKPLSMNKLKDMYFEQYKIYHSTIPMSINNSKSKSSIRSVVSQNSVKKNNELKDSQDHQVQDSQIVSNDIKRLSNNLINQFENLEIVNEFEFNYNNEESIQKDIQIKENPTVDNSHISDIDNNKNQYSAENLSKSTKSVSNKRISEPMNLCKLSDSFKNQQKESKTKNSSIHNQNGIKIKSIELDLDEIKFN